MTSDQFCVFVESRMSVFAAVAAQRHRKGQSSATAEDILQDAILAAWELVASGKAKGWDESWVYTWIVRKIGQRAWRVVDKERSSKRDIRRTQAMGDNCYTLASSPDDMEARTERIEIIEMLPEREQQVASLIEQGHSTRSAAEALGLSETTIRKSRRILAEALA